MMITKGYEALSPDDQARHRSLLVELGITLEETLDRRIDTSKEGRPVVFSADLLVTTIIPKIVVIKDIAMMKRFGGVADSLYINNQLKDDVIPYPPAVDPRLSRLVERAINDHSSHEALMAAIPSQYRADVRKAMRAFVIGNSKRVQAYEPIINAMHFPQYAAVFAGNTLCVKANTKVTISPPSGEGPFSKTNPYMVVFSDVCIEEGGQILFTVPTNMTVTGTLQKLAAGQCSCPSS